VRDGKVTRTDVKYIILVAILRDIVQDTNAKSARAHQRALLDFMVHLYTTPPVSTENIQHLLGPKVMEGWSWAQGDGGLELPIQYIYSTFYTAHSIFTTCSICTPYGSYSAVLT
jgi:hypothetical protein